MMRSNAFIVTKSNKCNLLVIATTTRKIRFGYNFWNKYHLLIINISKNTIPCSYLIEKKQEYIYNQQTNKNSKKKDHFFYIIIKDNHLVLNDRQKVILTITIRRIIIRLA